MHSIKLYGFRIGIKFDKDFLAMEQDNYFIKIVNVYIVYDLDAWSRNPTNNLKFKNCLFGATSIVKSFHNDTARNVFGVDNTSSFHADNCKNIFLVLGEGPILGINGSFGSPEKNFSINFGKVNKNFA